MGALMTVNSVGCYCGALPFTARIEDDAVYECHCSICTKKGFLHLMVPPDRFTLDSGGEALSEYRFNTGVARHTFCQYCGIHPFHTPRSHPEWLDVNVRSLDEVDLASFSVTPFDRRHWESNIDSIR